MAILGQKCPLAAFFQTYTGSLMHPNCIEANKLILFHFNEYLGFSKSLSLCLFWPARLFESKSNNWIRFLADFLHRFGGAT